MKRLFTSVLSVLFVTLAHAQLNTRALFYRTNDLGFSPTNMMRSNALSGPNISQEYDAKGGTKLTASITIWSNGVPIGQATNLDFTAGITGYVSGATIRLVATASGEANVNGEVSITNATRIGLVHDKVGVTNRLRSLQAGDGVTLTNEGTNIVVAAKAGYTLSFGQVVSVSPADSTTYYFGSAWPIALTSTFADKRIYVPKAGTLRAVFVHINVSATLGSAEDVSHFIRINDTTDVTLTSMDYNAANVDAATTGLSTALAAGDYVVLKITTPAWATNPTNVRMDGYLYIE